MITLLRGSPLLLVLLACSSHAGVLIGQHGAPRIVPDSIVVSFADGRITLTVSAPQEPGPSAMLMPLPVLPSEVIIETAAASPVADLLRQTTPLLLPSYDPDPCFTHPVGPPPIPVGLPPPQGAAPRLVAVLPADPAVLNQWLGARHLGTADGMSVSARSVLVVMSPSGPAGAAPMPVRLSFAATDLRLIVPRFGTDTTLLVLTHGQGIETSPPAKLLPPPHDSLPEFILRQFGWFLTAVEQRLEDDPVLAEEFSGPAAAPSGWITRLHLLSRTRTQGSEISVRLTGTPQAARTVFQTQIAWKGQYTLACSAGFAYRHAVTARWQREAATLANLTGWQPADIRRAMVADWQEHKEPAGD